MRVDDEEVDVVFVDVDWVDVEVGSGVGFSWASSRSRICFSVPTKSSSTLCWIPDEVSMNFVSWEVARFLPSVNKEFWLDNVVINV